ncbi:MAG: hypothetical protein N2B02_07445 [Amylibacter sp.]
METLRKMRNLVIVRAGKNSLHKGWLANSSCKPNWDLVISYYDKQAYEERKHTAGAQSVFYKGGKWDGIYKTVQELGILDRYQYIFLPDDDIKSDCQTINRLFQMMDEYALSVAQPSLACDSYFSHFHALQCDQFTLRFTNFVEIMVPCLRQDVFMLMLPEFKQNMSGFGLDMIWHRLQTIGDNKAAILDEISVCHTRPIGSQLQKLVVKSGKTRIQEGQELCSKFNIPFRVLPLTYAAISKNKSHINSSKILAFVTAYNQLRTKYDNLSRRKAMRKIVRFFFTQLSKKMDLTILQRVNRSPAQSSHNDMENPSE